MMLILLLLRLEFFVRVLLVDMLLKNLVPRTLVLGHTIRESFLATVKNFFGEVRCALEGIAEQLLLGFTIF